MSRVIAVIGIAALLFVAMWQLGQAGLLAAKAWAAPILLEYAFDMSEQTRQPVRPWPWADSYPIMRMAVPRLQTERFILSQSNMRNLAFGPTLQVYGKHQVMFGHRDTHFNFLKNLTLKDEILVTPVGQNITRWQVMDLRIMDADDLYVPDQSQDRLILLVTCYPFDGITENSDLRYVVRLKEVV